MGQYNGYTVRYESNRGNSITLTELPYAINIEPIMDYQWSYATKDKRRGSVIAGFAKAVDTKNLVVHIMAETVEDRDKAIDALNNVIDEDIYDGAAGKLWVNEWFTYGWFIEAKNTKWQYGVPVDRKEMTFVREQATWYHTVYRNSYETQDIDIPWQDGIKHYELQIGHNKFKIDAEDGSNRGIDYHVDNDVIYASGTASSYSNFEAGSITLPAGDYTIIGCPAIEGVALECAGVSDIGAGAQFTLADETEVTVNIHVGNVTLDNAVFRPHVAEGGVGSIGYDYPFDYGVDLESQIQVTNPNPLGCNWIMNIMGPVDSPQVKIGDTVVHVNVNLLDGEYLTVDTTNKTVMLTTAEGEQINVFGARDPEYYLFELIGTGYNAISWNGAFKWDFTMIEERSEPRWHMALT